MKRLVAALAAVLVLAGCGSNDHKGEHCVRSHDEIIIMPVGGGYCGNGCYMPPVMMPISNTVCDQWAPDDPSTVKPS